MSTYMEQIEKLIDERNVSQMLIVMAQVCNEKADHLRSNWQDEQAARTWERTAKKLDTLADKTEV